MAKSETVAKVSSLKTKPNYQAATTKRNEIFVLYNISEIDEM